LNSGYGESFEVTSKSARDRPSGLRAFAEVFLVPRRGDVWLGTVETLEAAMDHRLVSRTVSGHGESFDHKTFGREAVSCVNGTAD